MDIPELGVEEGQEVGGFIQDEHVEVVKEQPKTNIKQYAEPSTSKQTEEQMECGSQNRSAEQSNRNDIASVKLIKRCPAKLTTFKRNVTRK
ncbi:unnamed protein product [Tenebrio molitor]|nr:unnamed protein product [Tenebrio molitor]